MIAISQVARIRRWVGVGGVCGGGRGVWEREGCVGLGGVLGCEGVWEREGVG